MGTQVFSTLLMSKVLSFSGEKRKKTKSWIGTLEDYTGRQIPSVARDTNTIQSNAVESWITAWNLELLVVWKLIWA